MKQADKVAALMKTPAQKVSYHGCSTDYGHAYQVSWIIEGQEWRIACDDKTDDHFQRVATAFDDWYAKKVSELTSPSAEA